RRRFDQHLELIVVLQPEGIVAIAAIRGPSRGLHKSGAPGLRADCPQKGRGMKSARADRHVVGLQDDATLLRPVTLQRENEVLKGSRRLANSLVLHPLVSPGRSNKRVYASRRRARGPGAILNATLVPGKYRADGADMPASDYGGGLGGAACNVVARKWGRASSRAL